ncbi:MAG TPA: glycosyltransferase [Thermoanaerobaculia bacterium]|nr:glycosyltransferase [Thermoanaerobaculia bacterium]
MRILHVVPTYLPARRYGGPIVAVHGLCKALAAHGHEVDVFTTNVDGDGTLDVPLGTPVERDGVHIRYFASPFPRLYWSPQMRKSLGADVRTYDLVHSHAIWLWPGAAAARAARNANVPYVISPRGMLVPELIREKSALVKRAWLALVERRVFAHASAIHFTSQLEWDDAKRTGAVPLPDPFVVPNGIELEPRPSIERETNTIVFLGRINWKKRLDVVIESLPPNARLKIAGNDEENLTPRLRAIANERVEFLGPVYGAAKNELLASATMFVLPSLSENFGNVVLEALMMETPVIVTPGVGLADEVARANAGIVTNDVGGAMAELLADSAKRAELGANGRALVERRFAWERVAAEMEEAYELAVGSSQSAGDDGSSANCRPPTAD